MHIVITDALRADILRDLEAGENRSAVARRYGVGLSRMVRECRAPDPLRWQEIMDYRKRVGGTKGGTTSRANKHGSGTPKPPLRLKFWKHEQTSEASQAADAFLRQDLLDRHPVRRMDDMTPEELDAIRQTVVAQLDPRLTMHRQYVHLIPTSRIIVSHGRQIEPSL